jgi:uncharacterized protein YjbJ (UPF0337 family)
LAQHPRAPAPEPPSGRSVPPSWGRREPAPGHLRLPLKEIGDMNKDQMKVIAKETEGKVRKNIGEATGNMSEQAKGIGQEAMGKVQKNLGDAKEDIKQQKQDRDQDKQH